MKKILLFTLFIYGTKLLAWGADGHKIVADIAKAVLKKNICDSVQFFLQQSTFQEATVWMDEIHNNHKFDYLKPMHYVNIEKDKTYVKNNEVNIINKLESVIIQLKNRHHASKADIKMAIYILFHLMGDLHQPLHVGYADDKGGNNTHLKYGNRKTNLHRLWDSEIIEREKINLNGCLKNLSALTRTDKKNIQKINIIDWMNGSRKLLKNAYDFKADYIDEDYANKNAIIIQLQLVKAGLRLAAVLEDCFGKN